MVNVTLFFLSFFVGVGYLSIKESFVIILKYGILRGGDEDLNLYLINFIYRY